MSGLDIDKVTDLACEVAEKYNKPIICVMAKIHEGINAFSDLDKVRQYVITELEGW